MVNLSAFSTGFALSLGLIVAIGAQNLFVLRQGLKREHIGAIVLFCGLADALLIILGVSGLSTLVSFVPKLTKILTIGGAIFLVWYGIEALKRTMKASSMSVVEGEKISLQKALLTGASFTFLNPHVYLDTVLLMGAAGSAQPENLRPWFVFGAASASFAWFISLGFAARLLTPLFSNPKAWRALDAFVGVVMLSLAFVLLTG